MNQRISVRQALEDDATGLLALRQVVFEETEFMLWEPAEFKDSAEDERQRIVRANSAHNSACFVAEDGPSSMPWEAQSIASATQQLWRWGYAALIGARALARRFLTRR